MLHQDKTEWCLKRTYNFVQLLTRVLRQVVLTRTLNLPSKVFGDPSNIFDHQTYSTIYPITTNSLNTKAIVKTVNEIMVIILACARTLSL
jgi:hypothetical protein